MAKDSKQSDKFTWKAGEVEFIPPEKNKPPVEQGSTKKE